MGYTQQSPTDAANVAPWTTHPTRQNPGSLEAPGVAREQSLQESRTTATPLMIISQHPLFQQLGKGRSVSQTDALCP